MAYMHGAYTMTATNHDNDSHSVDNDAIVLAVIFLWPSVFVAVIDHYVAVIVEPICAYLLF